MDHLLHVAPNLALSHPGAFPCHRANRLGGILGLLALLGLVMALTLGATAEVDVTDLDETREFSDEGVNYSIIYTETDTGSTSNRVSAADVDDLEDYAKTSYDRLVNVMGFRNPWLSTLPDYTFIVRDDWWYAEPNCVVLDAPSIRNWPKDDSRVVMLHERFHTVQRGYKEALNSTGATGYIGSTFGKLVSEGTADAVMDKGYADLDDKTGFPFYEGSAGNFLRSWVANDGFGRDGPAQSLFEKDYDGCLWWNYLMEQLGTTTVEPHYGIDFMQAFWDQLVDNGNTGSANSKATMEQVITNRGGTLERLFHDFTICNYAREYDASGLADGDKYRYIDEQTQPITVDVDKTLVSIGSTGSASVVAWAANYFEVEIDGQDDCYAVAFKAESDGDAMAFSFIAVDEDGLVISIKKGRGTEFGAVFFAERGRPIARVCGIVAALEEDATATWAFDAGVPKIVVIDPTLATRAMLDTSDGPATLMVKTSITGLPALTPVGPGAPSFLGLGPEYFTVTIGGSAAPVIDAVYVDGLWEVLVNAPDLSDGIYGVTVSLCEQLTATSIASVLYGDLVVHHAVVLDISGSMTFPTEAKLNAAKQAAKFYIDSVGPDDKFTVVSFSGDGAECDDDAENLKGSSGLLDGSATSRSTMKNTVDLLSSEDLTSIGDGIWEGQDALDFDAQPLAVNAMLLLTDGKENESRFWGSNPDGCGRVDTRMGADNTVINTLAFGENAETDLCQAIATATGGDYLYNPVDETGARAGSGSKSAKRLGGDKAASADLKRLNNQLSLRFLAGLEHSKKLQRLALERSEPGGEGEFEVPILQPYDQVSQPLVYVGWSNPSSVRVEIEDPDGKDLAAISVVHEDKTHIVFHPRNPLVKGEYIFRVREQDGRDLEFYYGISGRPGNALNFHCSLSPVRRGGRIGRAAHPFEHFEQGMPVDINLAASDKAGPIRGLEVTVEVTLPDGKPACDKALQMLDDAANQDGAFNDGRYGLRYTKTLQAASYVNLKKERDETYQAPLGSSGTYRVVIRASGKDNFGQLVERSFEKFFQVFARDVIEQGLGDTDRDGMTDSWEIFYGTNLLIDDADEDPDFDGLPNRQEFLAGTHPHDPDSDNGGAADGYEVKNRLCPICPSDDPFPNLANVSVITSSDSHGNVGLLQPNALLLQFPDDPNYGQMEIYRESFPGFPCTPATLITTIDMDVNKLVTSHYDKGLTDGKRFYYKFRALSLDGQVGTPFSREVSAIARHDQAEPFGGIVLNNGQEITDRRRVAVKLLHRGNGAGYRLSAEPFNGSEPWLALPPYGAVIPFNLPSSLGHGDRARVYFQFRSPAGVTSRTYGRDITIDFNGDHDGNGGSNLFDPDDDNDGLPDEDELFIHGTDPFSVDTDGDGYSDQLELAEGSDPNDFSSVLDRDADGYSDTLETLHGADQSNANSTPNLNLDIVEVGNSAVVSFDTVAGVIYRVHNRADLKARVRDWNKLTGPIQGNGSRTSITVPVDPGRSFFGVSFELAPLE